MQIRVLGPVEVRSGERMLELGRPQLRHTLAALAVDAGRPVTVETLIDRVWDDAPQGARRTLHVHVTRIRQLLDQAGSGGELPARLLRRSGGYVLDIEPENVDLHRFQRLVEVARTPATPAPEVLATLRDARSMWRGEPLAGVGGEWARQARHTWRQHLLDVTVAWAQAETLAGSPDAAIIPLRDLAAGFPLVESLTAVLLRTLCAAGRPAEALEHYAMVRRRLIDELGVDPSPELQAVYQAILRGELAQPSAAPLTTITSTAAPVVTAAQLPADVFGFAGRGDHLAQLNALVAGPASGGSTAVVISAVSGTAGVGKTALAVHWAHSVAGRFPDGQLYVNLRGFDRTGTVKSPSEAVRGFLDALGVPPERIPPGQDAQAGLYRSLLAGKRILVVLDNARDADQVRPLLPGTAPAMAVVTSRNQLFGLVADGAHPLLLDLLSEVEAHELLTRRLGKARIIAEPDAVAQIISACARLPLALSIVAARAQQTGFALAALAAELGGVADPLDALGTGDPASQVRTVFSWSYTSLSPPAARLFRLLGRNPGPDIGTAAAASLAGEPVPATRRLLAELARASLLAEHAPGRYAFHDLLRAYAADRTENEDPEDLQRTATRRLLDHYTHSAYAADRCVFPHRKPIVVPLTAPAPGSVPEHFADHLEAMAWLTAELPGLLAALDHASTAGRDMHVWQLGWALDTFLLRRGHRHEHAASWQAALRAAVRLGDPVGQAEAHRGLAHAVATHGRFVDAQGHLQQALDLYASVDDPVGLAHVHHNLASIVGRDGRFVQALGSATEALALFRAVGHPRGEAAALGSAGWFHAQLGDYADALVASEQALALFQETGDREGQAATWDSIGYAHHHLGQHIQAAACYERAIALSQDLGHRGFEADVLIHLGDTQHASQHPAAARAAWTRALQILTELDHPKATVVRAQLAALD